ncbi:MAG: amino acid ABC transporter permease, partial [Mycobacteriales bacterium]
VLGGAFLLAMVLFAVRKFSDAGQLDGARWDELLSTDGAQAFWRGLRATLKAAGAAVFLSVTVGTVMALGRLSDNWLLRGLASLYVQIFRALPSLLLILFGFFGLPAMGIDVSKYWALVIGLTLYNSAIFAEVILAGVLSLPKGQAEAAYAVGMTRGQAQRLVVLPQAVSRMLPSLVAQGVVVLKDTSYGFVIGYEELLRTGQFAGESTASLLQAYLIVALVYIGVCFSLSQLARWLEGRTARRYGRTSVSVPGVESLATR